MDLKRNERFYKQNDLWRLLGGGLLIVGFVWFWIGFSAASYYGPCVMVPVGLIMFLVASARHVPESEIRGHIQKTMKDLDADIVEKPELFSQVLRNPTPYRGESFVYDERMKVARRGRDAKLLTDVYSATAIYFTKDALLLRGRTLNLSDGAVEDVAEKLLLTDVASATLEPYEYRVTITNKRREVAVARGVELQLKDREGRLLYCAPVPNDMDAEALCQSVMKKH
jgi:hypothetical protein